MLLDSGKNFLIHIIKEVITAITVNFSKFAYFSIYLNLKNEKDFFVIFYTKKMEYMIARILPQRCWTSKIIGLNP